MANDMAWGFIDIAYLFAEKVTSAVVPVIHDAIRVSYEQHNRVVDEMLRELVEVGTAPEVGFSQPSNSELQMLDNRGNPKPRAPGGYYNVGFPLRAAGDAFGMDEVVEAKATVEDMNRFTWEMTIADKKWLKRHMLAALFTDVGFTWYDEQLKRNLAVKGLANADAVVYAKKSGDAGTANHYLAQNATIGNANNPFSTIYSALNSYPGNEGPYVMYVPSASVSAVEGLTDFKEPRDVQIIYGADLTMLQQQVNPEMIFNSPDIGFGDRAIGYVNGIHVVEMESMPTNYHVTLAMGAAKKPVFMRQHEEASLQGLRWTYFTPDGNLKEYRVKRFAGMGVQNRTAAHVLYTGGASYAIPTGYDNSALG